MNGIDFIVYCNILSYLHKAKPEVLPYVDYAWCCSLLSDCIIFPFTDDIKNITINIRQSKKIKLPDAIIAATAIHYKLPLISADSGFKNISALTLITL